MTKEEYYGKIKDIIATEILSKISDKGMEHMLRSILFDQNNVINWEKALEIVSKEMPELKISKIFFFAKQHNAEYYIFSFPFYKAESLEDFKDMYKDLLGKNT